MAHCHASRNGCPWNVRFAEELPNDSPYQARAVIGDKDARHLARDLLGTTQAKFSAACKDSPMERAKRRGLQRNAAVVTPVNARLHAAPVPAVLHFLAAVPCSILGGESEPAIRLAGCRLCSPPS